ncbi:MAG TPA: SRPBCC family protein [Saprospiraceae bacterium]|nr:SRPBCC family protein [Saprospiraceae bacterium]
MKVYKLEKTQLVKTNMEEAWHFFSSPANLKNITPPYMGFEITSDLGDGKMYPGQIISYKVRPLLGIAMTWVTEITHVVDQVYFVDEQRFGPYKMWHHQHHFTETKEGVLMKDIVHYALPFDPFGRIAAGFVAKQLEEIFEFRFKTVDKVFP